MLSFAGKRRTSIASQSLFEVEQVSDITKYVADSGGYCYYYSTYFSQRACFVLQLACN